MNCYAELVNKFEVCHEDFEMVQDFTRMCASILPTYSTMAILPSASPALSTHLPSSFLAVFGGISLSPDSRTGPTTDRTASGGGSIPTYIDRQTLLRSRPPSLPFSLGLLSDRRHTVRTARQRSSLPLRMQKFPLHLATGPGGLVLPTLKFHSLAYVRSLSRHMPGPI